VNYVLCFPAKPDDSIFWSVDISSFKEIFNAISEFDIPATDVTEASHSVAAVSTVTETSSLSSSFADPTMPTSLSDHEDEEQYDLGEFLWDALIGDKV
jgi:hypothetical protein